MEVQRPVEAMALLEALVRQRGTTFEASARCIQFEFGAETWSFHPHNHSGMCQRGPSESAVLTVKATPAALARILTEPVPYLVPGEQLELIGDRSALAPLIRGLGGRF